MYIADSGLLHLAAAKSAKTKEYLFSYTPSDALLVLLGFSMIIVFMILIMTRRLTPMVALIVVPTVFGLIGGAGLGMGDMVISSLRKLAPTVALLMFAIIFFGLMIDVGLFDPLIRFVQKVSGNDPAKIVLGTAALSAAVSLDGDGSTTFIITTSAMLALYRKLGMNPVILTCVAGMMNGVTNILPWGGPTARAASALGVDAANVFVPMIPSLLVGLAVAFVFSWFLGLAERKRLAGSLQPANSDALTGAVAAIHMGSNTTDADELANDFLNPNRKTLRPKLFLFNLILTVVVMLLLILDFLPLSLVFMLGSAVALLVNFPKVKDQTSMIVAHGSSIVGVVSMVLAAGVLVGVLTGTGMVEAMAKWVSGAIPHSLGPYLAVITGLLSIPFTFFMSNDAFYFGILPVLAESAAHFGIDPVAVARASITGQPVHLQSPLVPAILLLVSLAGVNLGDHHKKVLWRTVILSLVMLGVAILVGSVPLFV